MPRGAEFDPAGTINIQGHGPSPRVLFRGISWCAANRGKDREKERAREKERETRTRARAHVRVRARACISRGVTTRAARYRLADNESE